MSVPAEVLAYFQVLAWPTVAVAGFCIFRQPIKNLIPRISEISAAGASVKFGQEAAKLADQASSLAEDVIEKTPDASRLSPPPGAIDPTASFLEAYRELESAAKDAAPTAGIRHPTPNPVQIIRALAKKELVPYETIAVANEVRNIRNQVAHGEQRIDPTDAENLANAARSLALICIAAIHRPSSTQ
jgi:hypothetical protein